HRYNTSILDDELAKHALHPILRLSCNPALLARASNLAVDISFFLGVPEASCIMEIASRSPFFDVRHATCIVDYMSRICALSDSDPSLLLAHSYVRYLGDLSGGQIIRRH
ncbi:hypothetical protein BJ138DRAFT_979880, partial [Hygrophoropsis aurantiaca]